MEFQDDYVRSQMAFVHIWPGSERLWQISDQTALVGLWCAMYEPLAVVKDGAGGDGADGPHQDGLRLPNLNLR